MITDPTLGPSVTQAPFSFSGTGDNIIITATAGKLFKVLQMFFVVGATTNLTFKSGANSISGPLAMLANGAFFMDYIQLPLIGVNPGEAFIINSDGGGLIGGTIWYIKAA